MFRFIRRSLCVLIAATSIAGCGGGSSAFVPSSNAVVQSSEVNSPGDSQSSALFSTAAATKPAKGFMMSATAVNGTPTASQMRQIYLLGGRIVRYPIYMNYKPDLNYWIQQLNQDLDIAQKHCPGLTLVVDMHQSSTNPAVHVANNEELVQQWVQLAQALKNRPAGLVWLEILNEPHSDYNGEAWAILALRVAKAIRAIDQAHPIVVGAPGRGTNAGGTNISSLSRIKPLPGISNQIIEVHCWDWAETVQSADLSVSRKSRYPAGNCTLSEIKQRVISVVDFRNRYGVPVYVGEAGIHRNHPDAAKFLGDLTKSFSEAGIPLSLHAYREAECWNYEANSSVWAVLKKWLKG